MMSEQLTETDDGSTQSVNNIADVEEEEIWSWKIMSQFAREFICFLAFFLTTYATFQNRTQKFARPPPPTYLFDRSSMIQEYSNGQLSIIQNHVAASELSLVFFYAPWCAESRFATNTIEHLAKRFSEEVYFAAVNCWQPGGECKMQYPRVDSWPILMAYYPKGLAVQYNGFWTLKSVGSFVYKLLNPLQRIETEKDLLKAKLNNYAVVVGYFPSTQSSEKFQIFFQAAVKSLEHDSFREIEYAIVTGETIKLYNVTSLPAIEMHSLNATTVYSEKQWTVNGINNWIKKNLDNKSTWLEISGKKSWNLSQLLKKTPTLFMFHTREGDHHDDYYVLREIVFAYNDCRPNRSSSDTSFIRLLREEIINEKLNLKLKCSELINQQKDNSVLNQSCNVIEWLTSNINTSEGTKYINIHNYCLYTKNFQQSAVSYLTKQFDEKEQLKNNEWHSQNAYAFDDKQPSHLLQKSLEYKCWKLRSIESNSNAYQEINANFTGIGCKHNRTLSFVTADSDLYGYMMKSLGINTQIKNTSKSLVFIIDKENESTFQMKGEVSVPSLTKFIERFHNNSLSRNLRNKLLTRSVKEETPPQRLIYIKEINSRQLQQHMNSNNQNIVVLFYTSQCALCNLLSRTLLNVIKILQSANISIYRIDGENNDLSWEYTMDSYPTLLVVPRQRKIEAKVYPRHIQISTQNLLRFILMTLNSADRLHLLAEICQNFQTENLLLNCMKNFRLEVLNYISDILRNWRHKISIINSKKLNIIPRLQLLQTIYYLTFRIQQPKILDAIVTNIVILENS